MAKSYQILTLDAIAAAALERFPAGRYVIGAEVIHPDAILVGARDMLNMDIPATVRAIAVAGTETGNVPVNKMNLRGVPVFIAPGTPGPDGGALMAAEQVREYLEHGNIANAVNFPDVAMPRESAFRLGIASAAVSNMLGKISTALAGAGINIHNLTNRMRGDMAYILVDVDSKVPQLLIAQIAAIPGVLMVRDLTLE